MKQIKVRKPSETEEILLIFGGSQLTCLKERLHDRVTKGKGKGCKIEIHFGEDASLANINLAYDRAILNHKGKIIHILITNFSLLKFASSLSGEVLERILQKHRSYCKKGHPGIQKAKCCTVKMCTPILTRVTHNVKKL